MIYTKEIDLGNCPMVMLPDRIIDQSLLYDRDFHQWTQVLAEALRSGDFSAY